MVRLFRDDWLPLRAKALGAGVLLAVIACEGTPSGSGGVGDPRRSPPEVEFATSPTAQLLVGRDWAVGVVLQNQGGSGEFRVLLLAKMDTLRLTGVYRIRAGERLGGPLESGMGFFSPGPRRPTTIAVEARQREPQLWIETDRADVLPDAGDPGAELPTMR